MEGVSQHTDVQMETNQYWPLRSLVWLCAPCHRFLLGSRENRRWRWQMRRKSWGSAWGQDPQIDPLPLHRVLCFKAEGLLDLLFSLMLPVSTEWLEQLWESGLDSSRAMNLMLFRAALVHLRQTVICSKGAVPHTAVFPTAFLVREAKRLSGCSTSVKRVAHKRALIPDTVRWQVWLVALQHGLMFKGP